MVGQPLALAKALGECSKIIRANPPKEKPGGCPPSLSRITGGCCYTQALCCACMRGCGWHLSMTIHSSLCIPCKHAAAAADLADRVACCQLHALNSTSICRHAARAAGRWPGSEGARATHVRRRRVCAARRRRTSRPWRHHKERHGASATNVISRPPPLPCTASEQHENGPDIVLEIRKGCERCVAMCRRCRMIRWAASLAARAATSTASGRPAAHASRCVSPVADICINFMLLHYDAWV